MKINYNIFIPLLGSGLLPGCHGDLAAHKFVVVKRYRSSLWTFMADSLIYLSSDATHTLVCAILLLNSDLHGEVSFVKKSN